MSDNYPTDLLYTKDHEWARIEGGIATIGISKFAVEQLGNITLVELPKEGETVKKGEVVDAPQDDFISSIRFNPLIEQVEEDPLADLKVPTVQEALQKARLEAEIQSLRHSLNVRRIGLKADQLVETVIRDGRLSPVISLGRGHEPGGAFELPFPFREQRRNIPRQICSQQRRGLAARFRVQGSHHYRLDAAAECIPEGYVSAAGSHIVIAGSDLDDRVVGALNRVKLDVEPALAEISLFGGDEKRRPRQHRHVAGADDDRCSGGQRRGGRGRARRKRN